MLKQNLPVIMFLGCFVSSHAVKYLEVIDYETKNFNQWRNPTSGSSKHSIVTKPVRAGKYAAKYVMAGGRTESAGKKMPLNTELWYGWSLYVPKSYPAGAVGTLSQIHGHQPIGPCNTSRGNRWPILHIRYEKGTWGMWKRRLPCKPGDVKGLAKVKKDTWTDMVVHAKFTKSKNGFFTWWINGKKVMDLKGQTWNTCPIGPYFKAGLYAGAPNGQALYVDEIRIAGAGGSYEAVHPGKARPSDPGSDTPASLRPAESFLTGQHHDSPIMYMINGAKRSAVRAAVGYNGIAIVPQSAQKYQRTFSR